MKEWNGNMDDLVSRIQNRTRIHDSLTLDVLAEDVIRAMNSGNQESPEDWANRLSKIFAEIND